ncbi:MAG: LysM peptidoglycan-binding domain-containing protein [Clostridiaceae bacterium]|nr:LysM peptidoglycan-binding domain-containing protein [Clostridiaceae bacterium]
MSDLLKVNACVYSRKGYEREQNRDDFYMNGKFLSEHHIDNMEASIENRAEEFFFAVADHMEFSDDEQKADFSILREIGKFHEKITVQDGDIDYKTRELTARVTETVKYLRSFHDINDIPDDAPERQMGFAGLLLTGGKAIAATYGTGHIFYCSGDDFKHLTPGYTKEEWQGELDHITDEEEEQEEESIETDNRTAVFSTEPIELFEGDKFLLLSDGVYNALGEEFIEDILSMRSDSTYIAYRLVTEAMKRDSSDDMTAMVIGIERIKSPTGSARKPAVKPKTSALKNVPPPTYKHKKRNVRKYENIIYYVSVFMTAVLIILILFYVIRGMMRNLTENLGDGDLALNPTPIATLSPTPTPEVTPEPTPEPTPTEAAAAEVIEHTVQRGETLSSIARKYYGSDAYYEKLGKYNNIPAPYNTISIDQKIKIPPLEELLKVE